MGLNMKNFLDKILKIIMLGLFVSSHLFSMDKIPNGKREYSVYSSEEDLPFNNDEYFVPPVIDEKLKNIKIMYGDPMVEPNYFKLKSWLQKYFPELDASEQEEEYKKELSIFEKRNQMLTDMNLLEPVAKLYYVDRKIYLQDRRQDFKETNKLNLNELGLDLKEIDEALSFFDDIQNLKNAVDFSYNDPYVGDDLEQNIYPIVKIINIYKYFVSYLDDLNCQKYIKKASSFLENLTIIYFEYVRNNDIDINNKFIKIAKHMFCSIPEDIESLEQLLFAKKFQQALELLDINDVEKSISTFYEKYNYYLDFTDSEDIILNLIKNNKIENVINLIFNRIFIQDSEIVKKGLVDLLLKIEEVIVDKINNTKAKDKQKKLIKFIELIFSEIANWNKDNLDTLSLFLFGHILEKMDEISILQKIVNNEVLNLFVDKFKDLINNYSQFTGMIDVKLLKLLDYVSSFKAFNDFAYGTIFDLVFIKKHEFDEDDDNNNDMLKYATNFRDDLAEQKTEYELRLDESCKTIKSDIDLIIKKAKDYNEIKATTIQINLIDLTKDLLLLRFRALLYFFGYVVEYLSEKDAPKQTEIYEEFKKNRTIIKNYFDQIIENINKYL